MLNWRRDPGYEQRVMQYAHRRIQHELRMKRLESEIEQLRRETPERKL
jgi:hypothetical protein